MAAALNSLLDTRQSGEEALRRSEERFRRAFHASPVPKSITTLTEGRFVDVNERFLALTGLSRDAIIGRTVADLQLWEGVAERRRLVAQLDADGAPQTFELQAHDNEGQPIEVLISSAMIELQGQSCVLAVCQDVSARKRAETDLRLRDRAIASVHSGIIITDPHQDDNPIIYCNPGFERLTGYAASEILGRNCRFLQGPDTDPATIGTIRTALIQRRECRVTVANYRKDGALFWNDLTISPVHDTEGDLSHFIGIQTDITEQKQAELALRRAYTEVSQLTDLLRQSRDVLRTTFDGLDHGLMLLDSNGQILALNHVMARWFGTAPTALVGLPWRTARQRIGAFPDRIIDSTLHDGRPRHRRERFATDTGQQRVLNLQTLPLLDSAQALEQVIVSATDVTEQLQLEAMAAQSEQFAATGRLAMTIAHELNTPLLSVQSCLHLAEQAEPARRADYLQVAREELRRVSTILDQLLDLHRPSTATVQPVDVNALVERVLLLTSGTLAKQRVAVERVFAPNLPSLSIRADHLRQILLNLIFNAIDAMPTGGVLRLRTSTAPGQILIAVADTGVGIAPELQARIFEPFTTTKTHGSGLGLSICQRLVRDYRGSITAESTPDAGTVFTLAFPCVVD